MAEYRKVCGNPRCRRIFIAAVKHARTCGDSCRQQISRAKKRLRLGQSVTTVTQSLHQEAAAFELPVQYKSQPVPSGLRKKFGAMRDGEWKREFESMSKRMRMRVVAEETRSGRLWERWQWWVLEKFARDDQDGGWVVFTVTSASGREGPVRSVVRALGDLGLQGIVFYEGGGWNTLGDEKRFHGHGLVLAPAPEVRPLLIDRMKGILDAAGHNMVEEVRDRVLWSRYITKDAAYGDDAHWDMIGSGPAEGLASQGE